MSKKLKGNTGVKGGQLGNTNAEVWTEEEVLKIGNELVEWMKINSNILFKRFLLTKKINKSFLSRYKKLYPSFAELLKEAKGWQEVKFLEGGLKKEFDASITKFCLINHHGYVSEVTQTEQTGTQKIEFVDTVVTKKI